MVTQRPHALLQLLAAAAVTLVAFKTVPQAWGCSGASASFLAATRGRGHNVAAMRNSLSLQGGGSILRILRAQRRGGRGCTARRYKVTLHTPSGVEEFECPEGVFILDEAEDLGIELPYSCRTGDCSICTGKVLSGSINQDTQNFLTDEQVEENYCLTCVTKATSDVILETHCDSDVCPVEVTQEEMDAALDLGLFGDDDDSEGFEF